MDPITRQAVEDYDRLLGNDEALIRDMSQRLSERMQDAQLTFGGRLLCPFLRPNFVSPAAYAEVGDVCRRIFSAIEKAEDALGPTLWEQVDLTPEERELVAIDPGFRRSSPTSRMDSFLTTASYQFVELNAETPAGIAYDAVLSEIFLELPLIRRFQERYRLTRFRARERLLDTLLGCYREAGGSSPNPTIAVIDYEEVPTRTEHHMFREFFESKGFPALVCDPRHLSYEKGRLCHDGREIDIIYKRLLVNELLEKASELGALLQAVRERAVTMVNPFRCKPIHKKAIFAVLTDETHQNLFSDAERAAIRAHVPWTRRVQEGHTQRAGQRIDLPRFVLESREQLVMKPNDEYGGTGVFIGWEMTATEWEQALGRALESSYVVQERVVLERQAFLELGGDGVARDFIVDLDPFVFGGEIEGFLTRLSSSSLANVSSGGGAIPSFLVEPL
jgi:uncharacterized circularly permuted ATP-grasp superfamily protein